MAISGLSAKWQGASLPAGGESQFFNASKDKTGAAGSPPAPPTIWAHQKEATGQSAQSSVVSPSNPLADAGTALAGAGSSLGSAVASMRTKSIGIAHAAQIGVSKVTNVGVSFATQVGQEWGLVVGNSRARRGYDGRAALWACLGL